MIDQLNIKGRMMIKNENYDNEIFFKLRDEPSFSEGNLLALAIVQIFYFFDYSFKSTQNMFNIIIINIHK